MPLDQAHDAPPATPRGFHKQMSFLDHLESLRWHITRVLAVLLSLVVVMFVYMDWIMDRVILGPLRANFVSRVLFCRISSALCLDKDFPVSLQATGPSEQFMKALVIAFVGGLVVGFPYLVWELWRFIKPGLYSKEIKAVRGVVLITSLQFLLGISFAYFIITPFTLNFFAGFQLAPDIQNIWRIGEVVGLIVQIALAGGLLFELPVVMWLLARLGLVGPRMLRKYRRHAFVVTLIVSGVLTPDPSLISQLLLALPMFLLYEVSIRITARVERRRQRQEAQARATLAVATPS